MGRCPLVGNEEAHQWGQMVNVIESLYNKSTNAVTSNSNIFKMLQTTVRVRQSRTLSPSPFNISLEQTKTNALDKGMTLKMWCYTTGGNNLEHTVTNEGVKQRIWYLMCVYATLLESFFGRHFIGLTIDSTYQQEARFACTWRDAWYVGRDWGNMRRTWPNDIADWTRISRPIIMTYEICWSSRATERTVMLSKCPNGR